MHCVEDKKIVDNHHILSLLQSVEMEKRVEENVELKMEFFFYFYLFIAVKDMKGNWYMLKEPFRLLSCKRKENLIFHYDSSEDYIKFPHRFNATTKIHS